MSGEIVVFITASSEDEAKKIADALVEDRLVACANIVPGVQSVFRWQGNVCREPECLMMLKTRAQHLEAVAALVKQLHSYEVPEIVALPIIGGSAEYLDWIVKETDTGRDLAGE